MENTCLRERLRVLVAVADDEARAAVASVLREKKYEKHICADAEDAWKACRVDVFDIVVIGCTLDGFDGLELGRRIRSNTWGERTVLVMVEESGHACVLSDVLAAGADDVLLQPIDRDNVAVRLQVAEKLLENRERRIEAETFLRRAHDELDALVAQRTASLERTLEELMTEIRERRLLEEERDRLVTAIEQVDETIIVTDVEGVIQHANPAFERNTGFTTDEAVGSTPNILKSGKQEASFYESLWLTIKAGRVWRGHFINRRADGSLCEVDSTISPVRDEKGEVVNFVAVNRDVTERITLERQLRQAQRMEAIGRFAGEIAHDFGNLITVVQATADLVRDRLGPADPLQEDLKVIRRSTEAGGDLTRALLALARDKVIEPRNLDVNEVINDLGPVVRRLLPASIAVELDLERDLPLIRADHHQVEQVFLNLCANARDAMPDGGGLVIRTNASPPLEGEEDDPGSVQITVSDTGGGIDDENLSHIFEPFFTTKEQGQGSGLGLATVYGIVNRHGGKIAVASNGERGTTFTVRFPAIVAEPKEDGGITGMQEIPMGGSETILVVEDQEDLRSALVIFLSSLGYSVLDVEDGERAREVLTSDEGSVDLVITDLNMPRMNGMDLFRQCRERSADLRFLFCSGYFSDLKDDSALSDPATAFLEKPFGLDDVRSMVRDLLDRDLEDIS